MRNSDPRSFEQSRMEIMDLAQELGALSLLFENLGAFQVAEGQLYGIGLLLKQLQKRAEWIHQELETPRVFNLAERSSIETV